MVRARIISLVAILAAALILSGCTFNQSTSAMGQTGTQKYAGPKPSPEKPTDSSLETPPLDESQPKYQPIPIEPPETTSPNSELEPAPPGTPIHPFYERDGKAPTAPGLGMMTRVFTPEPEKIVYLTIDDGPYPTTTPEILKILTKEQVPATFFVIGRQVEKYPDLLRAEYDGGFGIGNHTYSHDYKVIYPSPEDFLKDLRKSEDVIEKIIGMRPQIIRAPGGTQNHFSVNYYNQIDRAGYLVFDWNVSTGDTAAPLVPVEQLVGNIESQMKNKKRAIILMHDSGGKTTTVEALPKIIDYLKSQGYEFGKLTPNVQPILFPGGFSR